MRESVILDRNHNYATVRDYDFLWTLLKTTPVICISSLIQDGVQPDKWHRDIAVTQWAHGMAKIGARGLCYVWAADKEQFIEECKRCDVEYILPNEEILRQFHTWCEVIQMQREIAEIKASRQ